MEPFKIVAMGRVNGADGAIQSSYGAGVATARIGAGVYTLQLPADYQIDPNERCCFVTHIGGAGHTPNVVNTDDRVTTVNTFDAAGAAADKTFNFMIVRNAMRALYNAGHDEGTGTLSDAIDVGRKLLGICWDANSGAKGVAWRS